MMPSFALQWVMPMHPLQIVEAVIDTGFTGFLSLPPSTITNLGLLGISVMLVL